MGFSDTCQKKLKKKLNKVNVFPKFIYLNSLKPFNTNYQTIILKPTYETNKRSLKHLTIELVKMINLLIVISSFFLNLTFNNL